MTARVLSHISGADVVVYQETPQRGYQWDSPYIEARCDERYPTQREIELVRSGHVRWRKRVHIFDAPGTIVAIMRNGFRPLE